MFRPYITCMADRALKQLVYLQPFLQIDFCLFIQFFVKQKPHSEHFWFV